jgi:hypothetical protein
MMRIATMLAALAACGALACTSPEAKRAPLTAGADIGNRPDDVQMHAGSSMYSKTPCLLPKFECPGPLPRSGLPGDFPAPQK